MWGPGCSPGRGGRFRPLLGTQDVRWQDPWSRRWLHARHLCVEARPLHHLSEPLLSVRASCHHGHSVTCRPLPLGLSCVDRPPSPVPRGQPSHQAKSLPPVMFLGQRGYLREGELRAVRWKEVCSLG